MDLGYDQAQDLEQRALGRILARQYVERGVPLFRCGELIDDRLNLPIARVQRSREIDSYHEHETIELGTLEVSLGNPHAEDALARAVSRRGIEIAGATKRAIAVLDPFAFETPIRGTHGTHPIALSGCPLDLADAPCLSSSSVRSRARCEQNLHCSAG